MSNLKMEPNMNQERKIIKKEISTLIVDGVSLESLVKELHRLIDEYGKNTSIEYCWETYSDDYHLGVFVEAPETDEEFVSRLAMEQYYEGLKVKQELADYNRLKAKFG